MERRIRKASYRIKYLIDKQITFEDLVEVKFKISDTYVPENHWVQFLNQLNI